MSWTSGSKCTVTSLSQLVSLYIKLPHSTYCGALSPDRTQSATVLCPYEAVSNIQTWIYQVHVSWTFPSLLTHSDLPLVPGYIDFSPWLNPAQWSDHLPGKLSSCSSWQSRYCSPVQHPAKAALQVTLLYMLYRYPHRIITYWNYLTVSSHPRPSPAFPCPCPRDQGMSVTSSTTSIQHSPGTWRGSVNICQMNE